MFDVTAHASPYNRTMCIDSFRTRFQGLVSCTRLGGFSARLKVFGLLVLRMIGAQRPWAQGPLGVGPFSSNDSARWFFFVYFLLYHIILCGTIL